MSEAAAPDLTPTIRSLFYAVKDGSPTTINVALKELADKCGYDAPVALAPYQPYNGALSFAEYDSWKAASEQEEHVHHISSTFDAIVHNILNSEDLTMAEKATRVEGAAVELRTRLAEPPEDETGNKGLLSRVKDLLGTKATKREDGKDFSASDFAYVPDATKPSTWKLRLTATPGGGPDSGIVGAAAAALGPGFRGNKVQIPSASLSAVKAKVRAAWKKANPGKAESAMPSGIKEHAEGVEYADDEATSFYVTKDKAGRYRWLAVFTNKYKDRDGEVFPESALREYVEHVEATKDYPQLWPWHIKARMGEADLIDLTSEGFMVASGTFDEGMEGAAKALAEMPGLGVSHGYWFDEKEYADGIYGRFRTYEISPLPVERAANGLTTFTTGKEVVTMLTPEKKQFITDVFGAAQAEAIEKSVAQLASKADEAGFSFKELVEEMVATADPPATDGGETSGSDASDEDGKQEVPAAEVITAAVKEALTPVLASVSTLSQTVKEQAATIAELQKSDDEKIATAMTARSTPGDPSKASSQSDSTIVRGSDAKDARTARKEADSVPALAPYLQDLGLTAVGQ